MILWNHWQISIYIKFHTTWCIWEVKSSSELITILDIWLWIITLFQFFANYKKIFSSTAVIFFLNSNPNILHSCLLRDTFTTTIILIKVKNPTIKMLHQTHNHTELYYLYRLNLFTFKLFHCRILKASLSYRFFVFCLKIHTRKSSCWNFTYGTFLLWNTVII